MTIDPERRAFCLMTAGAAFGKDARKGLRVIATSLQPSAWPIVSSGHRRSPGAPPLTVGGASGQLQSYSCQRRSDAQREIQNRRSVAMQSPLLRSAIVVLAVVLLDVVHSPVTQIQPST